MFPWGSHWSESCCICHADILTFSGCKRAVCLYQQVFHPQLCDRGVVCKGAGRYLWILGDWVSGASSIQYSGVGFPCSREAVNANFTGIYVWEQPVNMYWDIVSCQVLSYTSEWWGLFQEDSSRHWQKLQNLWQVKMRWCCGSTVTCFRLSDM